MFLYRLLVVDKSPYCYAMMLSFVAFVVIAVLQLTRGSGRGVLRALLICSVVSLFALLAGINDGFMQALNCLANIPASFRMAALSSCAASILAGFQAGFGILMMEACFLIWVWNGKANGRTSLQNASRPENV